MGRNLSGKFRSRDEIADAVVVGGGLAGLVAAGRLTRSGANTVLIDDSLPDAGGRLGGFAEFSGAKFSLLPAGQGLIPVAGGKLKLETAVATVLNLLKLQPLEERTASDGDTAFSQNLALRSYESIVLSPEEVRDLVADLAGELGTCTLLSAKVIKLNAAKGGWSIELGGQSEPIASKSVLYCGGRAGGALLHRAGAMPQIGKGLDVGVRLAFEDRLGVQGLRSIGPDAKFMATGCRTFCLNSPGTIYRYDANGVSVPGGVVADPSTTTANVGILLRISDKDAALASTDRLCSRLGRKMYQREPILTSIGLGDKADWCRAAWGNEAADQMEAFCKTLESARLIDWSRKHAVLWPLLDWHWQVFGLPASSKTSANGLYVAGDAAGHARGLLQAAVGGWLAAGEMIDDA